MWARVQLKYSNFPAESISVNAESAGGAGLIALHMIQYLLDVAFFKFIHGFREKYSALDHSAD